MSFRVRVEKLKDETTVILEQHGFIAGRNFKRIVQVFQSTLVTWGLLLKAAKDPEVGLGDFAAGVCVGPGARLSRVPALYPRKKKWRVPRQTDPLDEMEEKDMSESFWRQYCSSLAEYEEQVLDVVIVKSCVSRKKRLGEGFLGS